jgi:hypothetical protein
MGKGVLLGILTFLFCTAEVFAQNQGSNRINLEEYNFENLSTGQPAFATGGFNCSGNCPEISSDFARSGKLSMKTFVDRFNSPTMYRTEVAHTTKMEVNKGAETQDYWMGFSLYIPAPYPVLKKPVYEIVFQFHSSPVDDNWTGYGGYNPNLAFRLSPESDSTGSIIFNIKGSDKPYPQLPDNRPKDVFEKTIVSYQTGKWYDFVIHTRLDSKEGFTKVWFQGGQIVDYYGPNYYAGHGKCYLKFGLYNGWRERNIDEPVTTRTLYHDEFRFAWGEGADYDMICPK